jgi:hypothetical protein
MLVHFFGSRAYSHAPYKRGNNLTLIGAMALRGMVGEMTKRLEPPMDLPLKPM